MDFIYHVGDIIEVTETYGYAAVYNKKGQIVNSHVKDNVVKYSCEVLKVWTERFYTGNGKYNEFQVSTMKYLNGSRVNLINNHFELINSGNRSVKLHQRGVSIVKPEQSEFIKHDSGIISLIINTPKRWMDYWVSIDFKRDENDKPINGEYVVSVYLRDPDKEFSTRELFVEVGIDFDYRKYHQLEQQEKDQLVIYFIPMEMLL